MAVVHYGDQHYFGLSSDTKPASGIAGGARFTETDTRTEFLFDGTAWMPVAGNINPGIKKSGGWLGIGTTTGSFGLIEGRFTVVPTGGANPSVTMDADGTYATIVTPGTTAGGMHGFRSTTNITRRDYDPYYEAKIKPISIADCRISVGLVGGTADPVAGGEPLANLSGVIMHLNVGAINWKIRHNSGTATSTTIDTGIPAVANTPVTIRIKANNTLTRFHYSINNSTWADITTAIPAATTSLNMYQWIEMTTTAPKTMNVYYTYIESDK
jgi:hypothetical protein